MKSARIYDFTLPANGSFQLNVEGDYIRVMTSTGTLEIVTDAMRLGPLKAGQGQADAPFKRVTLNDKSGVGNVGTILVASSGFIDQRINGEVSVIDGGKSRTLANLSFLGYANGAPVAGQYTNNVLWNPPGSGKNAVVERVSYSTDTLQPIVFRIVSAAMTGVTGATSKLAGAAMSIMIPQSSNTASAIAGSVVWAVYTAANINNSMQLSEPIILPPGYGLALSATTVNSVIPVTYEFYEDAV